MGVVNGASNHSWIQSRNSTSANFYSLVLNPSGGNVGIGATSPAAKLHVRSSSSSVVELLRLDNSGNAADNGAKITWANADQAYDAGYISVIRNASLLSQDMVFATSSNWTTTAPSEKVRITGAGNVGIGTTSPGAKLEVAGGDLRVNGTGTGNIGITLKRTAGTTSDWYQYIPSGSDAFVWFQGGVGAERMRIDSSGNLLVGTTSAGTNLKGLQASNTTSTQWPLYTTAVDRGLIVVMSASDGIASYFITNSTTNVGSITCTSSATSYNTSSDYRRKSNVQDLTGSGSFIDALKPRTFDWDTGDKGVGFIAHEFAEVSPSSVHGKKDAVDSDGKPVYQAMQASSAEVIANLVAELQSVRQRLAALETR
jgi:hypothetical protein